MTKRRTKLNYAHPLDIPEGKAWYVPGQVGRLVPEDRGGKKPVMVPDPRYGYEPGGLRIGGSYHLGGEALSEADIQDMVDAGIHADVLPYLHQDRDVALEDYVSPGAAPLKDYLARRAGRDLHPGEQLPRPERQVVGGKRLGTNKPPASPEEGLNNLPGGSRRWKGLVSDEEAQYLSPGQAEKFVELFNELPPSEDYAAGARLGMAKRGWYKDAANAIISMFGEDAPKFTALLAATSPVKGVQENLRNASITWAMYAERRAALGREMTPREVSDWLRSTYGEEIREVGGSSMETEYPNIIRALTKGTVGQQGTLSGPKVDSFARNLLHKLHAVTNDTWMAAFGGVEQRRLIGVDRPDSPEYGKRREVYGGGYAAASAKAREAAQMLNRDLQPGEDPWEPAEVQETTWSVLRSLADTMGGARYTQRSNGGQTRPRDIRASEIPDPDQTLHELTNKKVHGNADFLTLLLDALGDDTSPTGKAIKRWFALYPGMGKKLDRLGTQNTKTQAARLDALPTKTTGNLRPQDREPAGRVARKGAEASRRFDNRVVQESRQGRRRRYMANQFDPRHIFADEMEVIKGLTGHQDLAVRQAAVEAAGGNLAALYELHDALLDVGDQAGADQLLDLMAHTARDRGTEETGNEDELKDLWAREYDQGEGGRWSGAKEVAANRAVVRRNMETRPQPQKPLAISHDVIPEDWRPGQPHKPLKQGRRGVHRRVRYQRPEWSKPSFNQSAQDGAFAVGGYESDVFMALYNHEDPEVRELAQAAFDEGDVDLLILAKDRLLDLGEDRLANNLSASLQPLFRTGNQWNGKATIDDAREAAGYGRLEDRVQQARWKSDPQDQRSMFASEELRQDANVAEAHNEVLSEYAHSPRPEGPPKPRHLRKRRYMARPSHVPMPPANANYLPFQPGDDYREFIDNVQALGDTQADMLLQRLLISGGAEDAWLDLIDHLDCLDQGGNAQAGDIGAEVKVGVGNDMTQRVPQHRWQEYEYQRNLQSPGIAEQWREPRDASVREARRRRLEQQYQQHPQAHAQALGHAAFTDQSEDPVAFDALADWHEEQGEQPRANLVRSLRPRVQKQRRDGVHLRYADSLIGASSNTEENLSFEDAFKRVQSGDQKVFKGIADQMTRQLGLQGTSYSAVGDWEDGAEQSILTQIPGQADMDTLRYVGAWQGLTGNQRAVLVFRPDHQGLDSVYQIQVPETDVAKVRANLSKYGVPFRTLVPGKQGTKVVIYDQKRKLRDNVTQFAGAYHASVRESVGSGDYVGGSTRSAARAAYRKIIAEYEAKTGRRTQPGQAGGPVHQGQADQPGGRRGTEAAQEAQGRGGRRS